MDKFISMGFQFLTTVIDLLTYTAKLTVAVYPTMFNPLKTDVALLIIESLA